MNDRQDKRIQSPGMGMTVMRLSQDPLATEGEATAGPDDYNPFEDPDVRDLPTAGGVGVGSGSQPDLFLSGQPEMPPSPLADSGEWMDPDWPDFLR